MKEGSIVLTAIPQADGKTKLRPALLLRFVPPYNDCLVCGISSKLHQYTEGFDELVNEQDDDYSDSGLIQPSVIRLGFLAVLPKSKFTGAIGNISKNHHQRLLLTLANYLTQSTKL